MLHSSAQMAVCQLMLEEGIDDIFAASKMKQGFIKIAFSITKQRLLDHNPCYASCNLLWRTLHTMIQLWTMADLLGCA